MTAVECHRWLHRLIYYLDVPDPPWPCQSWDELVRTEPQFSARIDSYVADLLAGRPVLLRLSDPLTAYFWNQRMYAALVFPYAATLPGNPFPPVDWHPYRHWLLVDWWHAEGRENWATRGGSLPDTEDTEP